MRFDQTFRPFEWAIQEDDHPFVLSYTKFVKDTVENQAATSQSPLKIGMDYDGNPGVWQGRVKKVPFVEQTAI